MAEILVDLEGNRALPLTSNITAQGDFLSGSRRPHRSVSSRIGEHLRLCQHPSYGRVLAGSEQARLMYRGFPSSLGAYSKQAVVEPRKNRR